MPSPQDHSQYVVLDHIVTPDTNEIALGDQVTRIEPKSMEVLVHLFAHAGEVVSRDQLQEAIWSDVIVGDDSLTNAIIKIRKAFGDDARNPRVIETIPKRGYRLIADVSPLEPRRTHQAKPVGVLAASVGILVLVAGLFAAFWKPDETPQAVVVRADDRVHVAVARFQNISGDPAQDYLAQGVQQSVLNGLVGVHQVAASQLETGSPADYHLEGNVLRADNRIRIDTRLSDANTGVILSTQRHDRDFSDILEVQALIEADVVTALALDIDLAHRTAQSRGLTESIDAYDLFLQARAALLPRDPQSNSRARELYQKAIMRDPNFARAYGGLALTHAADFRNGWVSNADHALDQALTMAETALSIEPNLPDQYWVIGYVQTQRRNFTAAEAALNKARKLDPGYADALALLGGIRTYAGQPADTLPLLREAIRLRPDAGYLYFLLLGRAYYFLDDCKQALINLGEASTRNPSNLEARIYIAACKVKQGDVAEGAWEVEEVLSIEPSFSLESFWATYPMISQSQIMALTSDLGKAGLR
ncbi:Transcriptional activator CadC [Aliiroseovarius pelagivivens]|uniref:Transcriptional activator CadC n=1 Tax=Aliiroseovarius pelagivivens TaxID=1639690 RepID=A0A2R8AJR7_9RHOB|nr:winged helix-turn-helix domain-containing protein [Aliiroseovarius pelagivivens]SPF76114.1 Transcriptional activator CadC [Aliiroseovarius pelagivivens]